jgi:hypothetical protein
LEGPLKSTLSRASQFLIGYLGSTNSDDWHRTVLIWNWGGRPMNPLVWIAQQLTCDKATAQWNSGFYTRSEIASHAELDSSTIQALYRQVEETIAAELRVWTTADSMFVILAGRVLDEES